ncbi:MAG: hypothetical protein IJU79_00050 [Desulfovibrionaceae bacterium]|nr:hypothetical protein [Desulfovibrionaceae bacterium]
MRKHLLKFFLIFLICTLCFIGQANSACADHKAQGTQKTFGPPYFRFSVEVPFYWRSRIIENGVFIFSLDNGSSISIQSIPRGQKTPLAIATELTSEGQGKILEVMKDTVDRCMVRANIDQETYLLNVSTFNEYAVVVLLHGQDVAKLLSIINSLKINS